ncbi:hypothetical protein SASPL_141285 [Salvia splendens]|uniref:COMPASS component SWD2 n=1 Tax=Salvia splendens TaxID=180675 RepID=A0A8X8WSQ3_SALSN|nr:hypothetical protein SASPL_141285 [Salvia splendens]
MSAPVEVLSDNLVLQRQNFSNNPKIRNPFLIVCNWSSDESVLSTFLNCEEFGEAPTFVNGGRSVGERRQSFIRTDGGNPSEYGSWNGVPRLCYLPNGRISSMDFHKTSGYLVTASDDESIRLYDVASATCLKTINSKKYGVDLVSFTSHPTTVIYSSKNGWDESLRLLSLHDNKYLRVVSLSLCSRNDCFVSGSLDRTVLLWDQRAEKCQGLLRVQGRPAAAYDDQGLVFSVAFGGYIRMFDTRKYEKGPFDIFSLGGDVSEANVVKFSNDGGLMLLTTSNGHIHVLDSFRGTLLATHNVKPVSSNSTLEASFSPEGTFVISGSGDGSVYVWSVRSGKEVASWMSTEAEPPVIKWAPGNLMFVTGSSELSFWIPDLSKLAAYVGRK